MKLVFITLLVCCFFAVGSSFMTCGPGETPIMKSDNRGQCLPDDQLISGCERYFADDLTKCTECIHNSTPEGAGPNYTGCNCDGKPTFGMDSASTKVCVADIPNCELYLASDLTKCHSCYKGATPAGPGNAYTACDCTATPNIVKTDSGVTACIATLIDDCVKYSFANPDACHTCRTGAEPTGSAGSYTACDCTGKPFKDAVDQQDNPICAAQEIANCLAYSESNSAMCQECIALATPVGSTPNITECQCDHPNFAAIDHQGTRFCVKQPTNAVKNCEVFYLQSYAFCHRCAEGYERREGQPETRFQNCDCAAGTITVTDENGDEVCAPAEIDNCKAYANADPSKCHTCNTGYTGTGGTENAFETCPCTGGTEKTGYQETTVCVTTEVEDCDIYDKDVANKCYQCFNGFVPTDVSDSVRTCVCDSATRSRQPDGQGGEVCMPNADLITNCIAYSKLNLDYCHTCIINANTGGRTSPNIISCICTEDKIKETNTAGEKICVTAVIDGCIAYNKDHPDKCHTCAPGSTGTGTEMQFTECVCDDNTKVFVTDEADAVRCGADIDNCDSINSANVDVCYECTAPFSGNGSSNDHTTCACPTAGHISVADETGAKHCAAEIDNCDTYSSANLEQCDSCVTNSLRSEDKTTCTCGNPGVDENGTKLCLIEAIKNCLVYNSSDLIRCYTCIDGIENDDHRNISCWCSDVGTKQDGSKFCPTQDATVRHCLTYNNNGVGCLECQTNFDKVSETECSCGGEKFEGTTEAFETLCADRQIESCQYYLNETQCQVCHADIQLSDDKTYCGNKPVSPNEGGQLIDGTSSGALLSLSMVVLALVQLVFIA